MPALGSPGSAESWFVVYTVQVSGLKFGQSQYHIVQLPSAPAFGSRDQWGTVTEVRGPYASKTAAENAIGASGTSGESIDQPGSATQKANQPPSNPLSGLAAIGDFFGRLTEGSTWVRVGEVVLGLILLAVGVARITHAVPAATRLAKTVGAVSLA